MKAYIDYVGTYGGKAYAQVVTQQDYYDGGPHAHTHREAGASRAEAELACEEWCVRQRITITTAEEI